MLAISSVEVWPWAAGAAHRQGRLGPRVGRGFPGVGQVVRVRRTRTTWGRKSADEKAAPGRTVEVAHPSLLAAMTRARPEGVAAWVQGCWKIENREPAPLGSRCRLRPGAAISCVPPTTRGHGRRPHPPSPPDPRQNAPNRPSDQSADQPSKPTLPAPGPHPTTTRRSPATYSSERLPPTASR